MNDIKVWTNSGKKIEGSATASEAIERAGLNWRVHKAQIYAAGRPIQNRFAVMRDDDNYPLGIVSGRYETLQNIDAFKVADSIVGLKEAHYESAGMFNNGRKIWLLIRLNNDLVIGADDTIKRYLLATNSHDGSSAVRFAITPMRIVCSNTLTIAFKKSDALSSLRHSGNLGLNIQKVRDSLGLINAAFGDFKDTALNLASKQVNKETVKCYLRKLDLAPTGLRNESKSIRQFDKLIKTREMIEGLFDGCGWGSGLKTSRGTAWGLYNAVTEYVDHYKMSNSPLEKVGRNILEGSGAELKNKAFKLIREIVA